MPKLEVTISETMHDSVSQGTRLKNIIDQILLLCPELKIHSVISNTTSKYDVYLQYKEDIDCGVHIYNSNSVVYVSGVGALSSTPIEPNGNLSTSSSSSIPTTYKIEVARFGDTFLGVGIIEGDSSIFAWHFQFLKLTERFTGENAIICSSWEKEDEALWVINTSYRRALCMNGKATVYYISKGTDGLTPNNLAIATPVIFYTEDINFPFSGIVGSETPELFICLNGNQPMSFSTRYNRFSINGKNFVNINKNLCFLETE